MRQASGTREWISLHLPKGSGAVVEGYAPWVDPDSVEILNWGFSPVGDVDRMRRRGVDRVIPSNHLRLLRARDTYPDRTANYQALLSTFEAVARFRDRGYEAIALKVSETGD
jgi:hypothetical protein